MKPRIYSGTKERKKPVSQNAKAYLPSVSLSLKPVNFGNQYVMAAKMPNSATPTIMVWKCATKKSELCSWKSAAGVASTMPARPPKTKVQTKPRNQYIGVVNRMRPRNNVNSQLKSNIAVGIVIISVEIPNAAFTSAPAPIVKKWCSQTNSEIAVMPMRPATCES